MNGAGNEFGVGADLREAFEEMAAHLRGEVAIESYEVPEGVLSRERSLRPVRHPEGEVAQTSRALLSAEVPELGRTQPYDCPALAIGEIADGNLLTFSPFSRGEDPGREVRGSSNLAGGTCHATGDSNAAPPSSSLPATFSP